MMKYLILLSIMLILINNIFAQTDTIPSEEIKMKNCNAYSYTGKWENKVFKKVDDFSEIYECGTIPIDFLTHDLLRMYVTIDCYERLDSYNLEYDISSNVYTLTAIILQHPIRCKGMVRMQILAVECLKLPKEAIIRFKEVRLSENEKNRH